MQNIALSPNVRRYFVNALKGLGLRDSNQSGTEMNESFIERMLDDPNTTTKDLYNVIKSAVLHQLETDTQTDKLVRANTSFNRQTVKSMMLNNAVQTSRGTVNFNDQFCDDMLQNLTDPTVNTNSFNLDYATEDVIASLRAGAVDQKLNPAEKGEAGAFWNEIYNTNYRDWLISKNAYDPNLPYEQQSLSKPDFYHEKAKDQVLGLLTARCNGDAAVANEIMAAKVNEGMLQYLSANGNLLNQSCAICAERGKNPQTDLTMGDVFTSLGQDSSGAQVLTYFQTRSKEQDEDQKQHPKTTGVTKENKIGNLLGKHGRENVKIATGGKSPVVNQDVPQQLKKGGKGPWRGYKALYERMVQFLSTIYEKIPAVGYTQKILERRGVKFNNYDDKPVEVKDLTKLWTIEQQPMSDIYQTNPQQGQQANPSLNVAGEFYNKSKARLLSDQAHLLELEAQMHDDCQASPKLASLNEKAQVLRQRLEAAEKILSNPQPDQNNLLEIKMQAQDDQGNLTAVENEINQINPQFLVNREQADYLRQRKDTAEKILAQKMPKPNTPMFQDAQYFQDLEDQILAEKENQNHPHALAWIAKNKDNSANDEMAAALRTFGRLASAPQWSEKQNAKRMLAMELFHLQDKVQNGELGGKDINDMADRFAQSSEIRKMANDLGQLSPSGIQKSQAAAQCVPPQKPLLDSRDYQIRAVDINAAMINYAQEDLKSHAMKNQYFQHLVNQNQQAILQNVNQEMER